MAVVDDIDDLFAEVDRQPIGIDHPPVIAKRLDASRFFERRDERQPANLQELWSGAEHHVDGKLEDRIDQHALFDNGVIESGLLRGDAGGQIAIGDDGAVERDDAGLAARSYVDAVVEPRPERVRAAVAAALGNPSLTDLARER